jgi:hypothetical protein
MYKVNLKTAKDEGDLVRKVLNLDHDTVYPDKIAVYIKDGAPIVIRVDGLSDEDYNIHVAWLEMRARNAGLEYEEGEVTQRANEKEEARADAAKAERTAQEALVALEENGVR